MKKIMKALPHVQINIIYPYEPLWERFRSLKFSSELVLVAPNPDVSVMPIYTYLKQNILLSHYVNSA
jgi:hypothetical protein